MDFEQAQLLGIPRARAVSYLRPLTFDRAKRTEQSPSCQELVKDINFDKHSGCGSII